MTAKRLMAGWLLAVCCILGVAMGHGQAAEAVQITDLQATGTIKGDDLHLALQLTADADVAGAACVLLSVNSEGRLVLASEPRGEGWHLRLVDGGFALVIEAGDGPVQVAASFVLESKAEADKGDRSVEFALPPARARRMTVGLDDPAGDISIVGAVGAQRTATKEGVSVEALLPTSARQSVRWRRHVDAGKAELLVDGTALNVVTLTAGRLALDAIFALKVNQGTVQRLRFALPEGLNVTQVESPDLRDWRIEKGAAGEGGTTARPVLVVALKREISTQTQVRVWAEQRLAELPAEQGIPVIEPLGLTRTEGYLAVGTDSALQLQVKGSNGLSQIDAEAFPRVETKGGGALFGIPRGKVFCYMFPAMPYRLTLAVDEIVPIFDVDTQLVAVASDDNLELLLTLDVEVREAPISRVRMALPTGFLVAAVEGSAVADNSVADPATADGLRTLTVTFREPVMGHTAVQVRLETGRTPLGTSLTLAGLGVEGARAERGFIALAGGEGVVLAPPTAAGLREVNTRAIPMRVVDARFAYRFRERGWALEVAVSEKPPAIRAETFHLISLGDGLAYNSVVMTYVITGAPVDELLVRLPADFTSVEFVGLDVSRWVLEGDVWHVKLRRKVIGDYNLGVTAIQRYEDGGTLAAGGVACMGVDTQTGYVALASHRDVQIKAGEGATASTMIVLANEELPASYRLLVNAPILRCYKSVDMPVPTPLTVTAYAHGSTPTVLLDFVRAETVVSVNPAREAEAMTTIRYTLKNGTAQFLDLDVPADLEVWSTRQLPSAPVGGIASGAAEASAIRLTAARETLPGGGLRIKVPLSRQANPNTPITVEVTVGQILGHLPFSGRTMLKLPVSQVPATYSTWQVGVPEGWVVREGGASRMEVSQPGHERRDIGMALAQYKAFWKRYMQRNELLLWGAGILQVLCIAGGLIAARRQGARWLAWGGLVAALVVESGVCLLAASTIRWAAPLASERMMAFRQVLNLDAESTVQVGLEVVPGWRADLSPLWLVVYLVLTGVAIVAATRSRTWRMPLVALAIASFLLAALQTPFGLPICLFALTVVVPIGLLVWAVARGIASWRAYGAGEDGDDADDSDAAARSTGGGGGAGSHGAVPLVRVLAIGLIAAAAMGLGTGSALADDTPAEAMAKIAARRAAPTDDGWDWFEEAATQDETVLGIDARVWVEGKRVRLELEIRSDFQTPKRLSLLPDSWLPATYDNPVADAAAAAAAGTGPVAATHLVNRQQVLDVPAGPQTLRVVFVTNLPAADNNQGRRLLIPLPDAFVKRAVVRFTEKEVHADIAAGLDLGTDAAWAGYSVTTRLAPVADLDVRWRPEAFAAETAPPEFVADVISFVRTESGLIAMQNRIDLRIARGSLDRVVIRVPEPLLVASVAVPGLDTWRFDLETRLLTLRLKALAERGLRIDLATQIVPGTMPYEGRVRAFTVDGAESQHTSMGVAASPETQVTISAEGVPTLNLDDFRRRVSPLVQGSSRLLELEAAFRLEADSVVQMAVQPVEPEIRVAENAAFTIADDRLVYTGRLEVDIAKANIFHLDLVMPTGYDIDRLSGEAVSHWDDTEADGLRQIRVYFKGRRRGKVALDLALSRPVTALPDTLSPPRIDVPGALKHSGQLTVSADRGVRLSIGEHEGVSELDTARLGLRDKPAIAVKLLRPAWTLVLQVETLAPRLDLSYLHLARVSDGLVRHTHYLRYQIQNAGERSFDITVPPDALGLVITGPEIARRVPLDEPGHWRIELSGKWFDQTYPLEVRYETRYDAGTINVLPVVTTGTKSQRGYVAILTGGRVAVTPTQVDPAMQTAEARTVPSRFGADDLADAVFCYSVPSGDYKLQLRAVRHEEADLLTAEVLKANLTSIVDPDGATLNRVELGIRTGAKRHLRCLLPEGADVWSLLVDRQARVPSTTVDAKGRPVLLIPLPQSTVANVEAHVELIYVAPPLAAWSTGHQVFDGPRFDLPLRDVQWEVCVPEGPRYHDFSGTLDADEKYFGHLAPYTLMAYLDTVNRTHAEDYETAVNLQRNGLELAKKGEPAAARLALEQAYSYSVNDRALNEDARVNLRNMLRQQAMVGLVERRHDVRDPAAAGESSLGANFTLLDAARLKSGLAKPDSENLESIANRILDVQEAAAPSALQILVTLPEQGQVLRFHRPLQVEPDAAMTVSFQADAPVLSGSRQTYLLQLALLIGALLVGLLFKGGGHVAKAFIAAGGPYYDAEDEDYDSDEDSPSEAAEPAHDAPPGTPPDEPDPDTDFDQPTRSSDTGRTDNV